MADSPSSANPLISELRSMPVHVSREYGRSLKKPLLMLLITSKIAHGQESRRFTFTDLRDELEQLISKVRMPHEPVLSSRSNPSFTLGTPRSGHVT